MEYQDIATKLIALLEKSVSDFLDSMPATQDAIFGKVTSLIKTLDVKGDIIVNSVANLRTIGQIKADLENIILNKAYIGKVTTFVNTYAEVAALHHDYFNSLGAEIGVQPLLNEIKAQSIDATINSLTESGITANIIEPVQDILRNNATTGGTISSYVLQMKDFLTNSENSNGALVNYSQQIATDAINQYSRTYHSAITNDLNWQWNEYIGSLLRTSRPFCIALVAKRYFHNSEIPELLAGHIGDKTVRIYDKTGLPDGMIDGTNQYNFKIYAGGYNCEHGVMGVPDKFVPQIIRNSIQ